VLIDCCIPTCTCTHAKLSKTSLFFRQILNLKRHSFVTDGVRVPDPEPHLSYIAAVASLLVVVLSLAAPHWNRNLVTTWPALWFGGSWSKPSIIGLLGYKYLFFICNMINEIIVFRKHVFTKPNERQNETSINLWLPRMVIKLNNSYDRSCCPGLREYLSGGVDLVGKHPSPRSFTCWCFGPWVVWSIIHFVCWLVTGFMIFSWSVW
jgi:hypothetical protein